MRYDARNTAAASRSSRLFIAGSALLALLITIVDQAFGLGKGGMITFENLLTIFAWRAFVVVAALSTVMVLVMARSRTRV